ncbi:MAG: tetratricopeptide repeat protein [Asticcacaulis sp.]
MATDSFGNAISTTDVAEIAALRGFGHGLLAYELSLLDVLKVVDASDASALTLSYVAVLHLLSETPDGPETARPFIDRARLRLTSALPREVAFFAFAEAWVSGDIDQALARSDALIAAFPRDLTAIKLRQYIDFNLGRFTEILRIGLMAQAAAPEVAYVHGLVAFGYEQSHLLAEAETAARRALEILPREPWAQHALAHVFLTRGRIDEGEAFLDQRTAQWQGLNSFMYTHLWWHLALFKLSKGKAEAALSIYDTHVWGQDKTYSQDQVGAVALLARLELAGIEVGDRWSELSDYLVGRADDVVEPFLSLQYLYGLYRASRPEAEHLLQAISQKAETAAGPAQRAWADCAFPLAQAIAADAKGKPSAAADHYRRGLPYLSLIGGSHAQRDLFEQFYLKALIDDGQWLAAQQILEGRRADDPDGVPLNRLLADIYEHLNLPAQAQAARQRIEAA